MVVHHAFLFNNTSALNIFYMTSNKPVYLRICISICSLLAHLTAAIHVGLISAGLLKTPLYLKVAAGGKYVSLHNIWNTRIVRRMVSALVRSPLRNSTLRLVNFNIRLPANSGCIILICHTPWKRLLVQYCIENDLALIIAYGQWTNKRGGKLQREGKGFNELRGIVKHLEKNGRIIMTVDNFNDLNNCPVKFLGSDANAELLPTRLARITQVPLIAAIPIFRDGTVDFIHGQKSDYGTLQPDPCSVIQNFLSALENEIKIDPSISVYLINKFYKEDYHKLPALILQ